ncbi:hypothetical protein ACQYD2_000247 [Enterobacter hormaechei]
MLWSCHTIPFDLLRLYFASSSWIGVGPCSAERWDEESFLRLMRDVLPEKPEGDYEPVNLDAERQNPVISWDEFAGNYK